MSDCPLGCGWVLDMSDALLIAELVGRRFPPLMWDGERIRQARMTDSPATDVRGVAIASHMCRAHPFAPEVLIVGPVVLAPTSEDIQRLRERLNPPRKPSRLRRLLSV